MAKGTDTAEKLGQAMAQIILAEEGNPGWENLIRGIATELLLVESDTDSATVAAFVKNNVGVCFESFLGKPILELPNESSLCRFIVYLAGTDCRMTVKYDPTKYVANGNEILTYVYAPNPDVKKFIHKGLRNTTLNKIGWCVYKQLNEVRGHENDYNSVDPEPGDFDKCIGILVRG